MNTINSLKDRDQIAAAYSSEPWWYDLRGLLILTLAYNSTIGAQLRFFGPQMGSNHIEIGIGTGTFHALVLRWRRWKKLPNVKITGIDYAESMLAGAKRRFANNPHISLQHADAAQLPYADNTFDTATIANSIHCFPAVDDALRDVLRVLKPGGTLAANVLLYPHGLQPFQWIATKINTWGVRKGILYTPYEREEIRRRIVAAGFDIISEAKSGNTCNVIAQKPSSI